MFDIAFTELVVVGVVALVVVGPARLPAVARVAGRMFGQFNSYVSQLKSEVSKEIERAEIDDLRKEFEDSAADIKSSVEKMATARKNLGEGFSEELSSLENSILNKETATIKTAPHAKTAKKTKPAKNKSQTKSLGKDSSLSSKVASNINQKKVAAKKTTVNKAPRKPPGSRTSSKAQKKTNP